MYNFVESWTVQVVLDILLIGYLTSTTDEASSEFLIPQNTGCACPGVVLTYNCTAVGTGSTVWQGTAFDCPANGIILRHDRFTSGGVTGVCTGAIQAQSLAVENGCYTSQLTLIVSSNFNNKTVACTHNSNEGIVTIGNSTIITQAPYPPSSVSLTNVFQRIHTFSWTLAVPNCTSDSISYEITSDCSSCPTTTNATNVTCFDLQLSRNKSSCNFSVNSVICGISGQFSRPVMLALKAPDHVPPVMVMPVYSSSNKTLIKFVSLISQTGPLSVTNDDDVLLIGTIATYNIYVNSSVFVRASCDNDECKYMIYLPSDICSASTSSNVNITISTANVLGEGPSADRIIIGCTNRFVEVDYNLDTFTITCRFLNQLDNSTKSCSVQYGECKQEVTEITSGHSASDTIVLHLNQSISSSKRTFCINASNDTHTVLVERRSDNSGGSSMVDVIVVIIIFILLIVAAVTVISVVIFLFLNRHRKAGDDEELSEFQLRFKDENLSHVKLTAIDTNEMWIVQHKIDSDCALKDFLKKKKLAFKRGCTFYQFTHDVESITEDKRIIFMHREQTRISKYYYPNVDNKALFEEKLLGEKVFKPSLTKYDVFIQSTGSGTRHLARDSKILYMRLQPHPLWHVDLERYKRKKLVDDCTLSKFCLEHGLEFNKCTVYLEFDDYEVVKEPLDDKKFDRHRELGNQSQQVQCKNIKNLTVIVEDKSTERLLTGIDAQLMVEQHINGTKAMDMDHWRIFISNACEVDLHLKKDMWIIYQMQVEQVQHPYLVEKAPLVHVDSGQIKVKVLDKQCELEELQHEHNCDSNESRIYVEKKRAGIDKKNVLDVILLDKESKRCFTGYPYWREVSKCPEDPDKKWGVFLLSTKLKGSSKLAKNSWVLLHSRDKKLWQPKGLLPLYSTHFCIEPVKRDDKLSGISGLETESSDVLVELDSCSLNLDEASIRDVFLMDKDTKKLYTGPYARHNESLQKENRWKVFGLHSVNIARDLPFEKNMTICYQNLCHKQQTFHVIKVDRNNVRMSEFIKQKLNLVSFENGKAFYEFEQEEDLLYFREVVLFKPNLFGMYPTKGERACRFVSFYEISGAPNLGVKPLCKKDAKVFIQSISQGSRCLKEDAIVLYKKE